MLRLSTPSARDGLRLRRGFPLAVALTASLVLATVAPAAAASDKRLAERGVIVSDDLPSTWASSRDTSDTDAELDRLAATIPVCATYLKVRKADKAAVVAESLDFTDGSNFLSNEVSVFPTTGKAKKVFADMTASTNATCFDTLFQERFAADTTVRDAQVTIDQSTDLPGLSGDETVAYGGPITVLYTDGTTDELLAATFAVRQGRSILTYSVVGPPDAVGNFESSFAEATDTAINDTIGRMATAR